MAKQIGQACREYGFFYIVGHGVDEELQQRLERSVCFELIKPSDADMRFTFESDDIAAPGLTLDLARVARRVLWMGIFLGLAFLLLDYVMNYRLGAAIGPLRRLFNITREDSERGVLVRGHPDASDRADRAYDLLRGTGSFGLTEGPRLGRRGHAFHLHGDR